MVFFNPISAIIVEAAVNQQLWGYNFGRPLQQVRDSSSVFVRQRDPSAAPLLVSVLKPSTSFETGVARAHTHRHDTQRLSKIKRH